MILKDKVTIVTGASSGVGKAIAEGFLAEGAHVAVCARRLERLRQLFGENDRAFIKKVDITDVEQVGRFVESVYGKYRRIDVLVNNAGVYLARNLPEIDIKDWRYSFAVNVEAPFCFCKLVVPYMKASNYGRIINLTSGAAVNCPPGDSAYSASKAALNALTRTLSRELGDYNIKVNMMSPGPCRTEMAPQGTIEPERAVPTAIFLATLPGDGPSGRFFWLMQELEAFPDLSHIPWLNPDLDSKLSR